MVVQLDCDTGDVILSLIVTHADTECERIYYTSNVCASSSRSEFYDFVTVYAMDL